MYKNILLPIVLDHEEGTQLALNAARLLADEGAAFIVMHVMESIPGYVRSQISEETLTQRRNDMQKALDKIATELSGATTALVSGHAGQTIVNFADEHDIDCIILSSHIPGIENFFIGSTANKVVHHAHCSVHVIR